MHGVDKGITSCGSRGLIKRVLRGYKGTASLVLIMETVVALIAPVVQLLEFCLAKAVTRVQIPAGAYYSNSRIKGR